MEKGSEKGDATINNSDATKDNGDATDATDALPSYKSVVETGKKGRPSKKDKESDKVTEESDDESERLKEIMVDVFGPKKKGIDSIADIFFAKPNGKPIRLYNAVRDGGGSAQQARIICCRHFRQTWEDLALDEEIEADSKESDEEETKEDDGKDEKTATFEKLEKLLGTDEEGMLRDAMQAKIDKQKLDNEERQAKIERLRAETDNIKKGTNQSQPFAMQSIPIQVPVKDDKGNIIRYDIQQYPYNPYMPMFPPQQTGSQGDSGRAEEMKAHYETMQAMQKQMYEQQYQAVSAQLAGIQTTFNEKIKELDPSVQAEKFHKMKDVFGGETPEQAKDRLAFEYKKLELEQNKEARAEDATKFAATLGTVTKAVETLGEKIGGPIGAAIGEGVKQRTQVALEEAKRKQAAQLAAQQGLQPAIAEGPTAPQSQLASGQGTPQAAQTGQQPPKKPEEKKRQPFTIGMS